MGSEADFNPNSLNAQMAVVIKRLDDQDREQEKIVATIEKHSDDLDEIKFSVAEVNENGKERNKTLEKILEQTTLHNGRMVKIEADNRDIKAEMVLRAKIKAETDKFTNEPLVAFVLWIKKNWIIFSAIGAVVLFIVNPFITAYASKWVDVQFPPKSKIDNPTHP